MHQSGFSSSAVLRIIRTLRGCLYRYFFTMNSKSWSASESDSLRNLKGQFLGIFDLRFSSWFSNPKSAVSIFSRENSRRYSQLKVDDRSRWPPVSLTSAFFFVKGRHSFVNWRMTNGVVAGAVLPDLCKPSRPALPLTLLVYGGDRGAQAQLNLRSSQPKSLPQYLYSSKKMVLTATNWSPMSLIPVINSVNNIR